MNDKIITTVNNLIQISIDGEKGFASAAEQVQRSDFKNIFTTHAQGCQRAAHELQSYLANFRAGQVDHDEIEDTGTMMGTLHRGWMAVKSSVTSPDDHAILEECERGEDAAKSAYSTALNEDLPSDLRTLIQNQYQGVVANHDQIRDLRNATA